MQSIRVKYGIGLGFLCSSSSSRIYYKLYRPYLVREGSYSRVLVVIFRLGQVISPRRLNEMAQWGAWQATCDVADTPEGLQR